MFVSVFQAPAAASTVGHASRVKLPAAGRLAGPVASTPTRAALPNPAAAGSKRISSALLRAQHQADCRACCQRKGC